MYNKEVLEKALGKIKNQSAAILKAKQAIQDAFKKGLVVLVALVEQDKMDTASALQDNLHRLSDALLAQEETADKELSTHAKHMENMFRANQKVKNAEQTFDSNKSDKTFESLGKQVNAFMGLKVEHGPLADLYTKFQEKLAGVTAAQDQWTDAKLATAKVNVQKSAEALGKEAKGIKDSTASWKDEVPEHASIEEINAVASKPGSLLSVSVQSLHDRHEHTTNHINDFTKLFKASKQEPNADKDNFLEQAQDLCDQAMGTALELQLLRHVRELELKKDDATHQNRSDAVKRYYAKYASVDRQRFVHPTILKLADEMHAWEPAIPAKDEMIETKPAPKAGKGTKQEKSAPKAGKGAKRQKV